MLHLNPAFIRRASCLCYFLSLALPTLSSLCLIYSKPTLDSALGYASFDHSMAGLLADCLPEVRLSAVPATLTHSWAVSSPVVSCAFCEGSWPGQLGDRNIQHIPWADFTRGGSYTSLATFQSCLPLSASLERQQCTCLLPSPGIKSSHSCCPAMKAELLNTSLCLSPVTLFWQSQ